MTEAGRDLGTLIGMGPVTDHEQVHATPCLRVDFQYPAPTSQRPGQLDDIFARALDLLAERFSVYAGEAGFRPSAGREPGVADIDQIRHFTGLMKQSEAGDAERKDRRKARLRGQGRTPVGNWTPWDHGTLILSDARHECEGAAHIKLMGFGGWRMSISFPLELYRDRTAEVLDLVHDLFLTGVPHSGNFGFACNTRDGLPPETCARLLLPPTRRFRLLNIGLSAGIDIMPGDRGVAPIGPWYWIDKAAAQDNDIALDDLRSLRDRIHALTETETGFLLKLYPAPVLGDLNHGADLAPAFALGAVLDPIFRAHPVFRGLTVGEQADQIGHLRRFAPVGVAR